ncbi:MAG: ribulose-phosphate 3-epimerase [Armatimonadota bacterium]
MNVVIAPSILSANFARIGEAVEALNQSDCEWIHIDVMDGRFVPPITFGAQLVSAIRPLTDKFLDCHLMVSKPEQQAALFAEAGANRVTIHAEATWQLHRALQSIVGLGVKAGVAINPATPVSAVQHVLGLVDLVLVMTVNPGWGGQRFLQECVQKVEQARAIAPSHWIEVDGGIDADTAPTVIRAGANALVAGNYVFSGDPRTRLEELQNSVCAAFK